MTWDESKHPRDEIGRFTNGAGSSEKAETEEKEPMFKLGVTKNVKLSPKEILFSNSIKENNKKLQEEKEANRLLKILGNKATPSDILYRDIKSLRKKIIESGLGYKIKTCASEKGIKINGFFGNKNRIFANTFLGKDAIGMLDIASKKQKLEYLNGTTKLNNINSIKSHNELNNFEPYMKEKIKDQFKDFNYDINDINGYIFNNSSDQVKRIKESEGFKNIIKRNKENIINNKKIFSGRFQTNNISESNLYNAFGGVDFLNTGIDKKGNLHLYMFDTYDFNKNESPLVEAGRRKMLDGTLKGYFSLHEITISKEELNEYFK